MVEAYPEISEMDLNPVIVYETGVHRVDARIILKNNVASENDHAG
ncbi:MAG: acetate--CoA ligase family protein [bacterium]